MPMQPDFEKMMLEKSDDNLEFIASNTTNQFQEEAVAAATQELKLRKELRAMLSALANEELLQYPSSLSKTDVRELFLAEEAIQKRGLQDQYDTMRSDERANDNIKEYLNKHRPNEFLGLKRISSALTFLALLDYLFAVVGFIFIMDKTKTRGFTEALEFALQHIVLGTVLLAIGGIIRLLIRIEYNTRITAKASHKSE